MKTNLTMSCMFFFYKNNVLYGIIWFYILIEKYSQTYVSSAHDKKDRYFRTEK